jgi:hypothetical protein
MGRIFVDAEKYIDQLDQGSWVEIGCGRAGDDGSTRIIAGWAASRGRHLFTVDMDPYNCDLVRLMALPNVEVVHSTGEDYLKSFPSHIAYISFLYLDNFDWDWHPEITARGPNIVIGPNGEPVIGLPENAIFEQHQRYQDLGMPEMNNINSQRAHMRQVELAMKAMGPVSLIVCDDTWFNPLWGHYSGKSGSCIPYLLNHGFEVLETKEYPVYGTILGRGIKFVKD